MVVLVGNAAAKPGSEGFVSNPITESNMLVKKSSNNRAAKVVPTWD
jgi:hypothetical protein